MSGMLSITVKTGSLQEALMSQTGHQHRESSCDVDSRSIALVRANYAVHLRCCQVGLLYHVVRDPCRYGILASFSNTTSIEPQRARTPHV